MNAFKQKIGRHKRFLVSKTKDSCIVTDTIMRRRIFNRKVTCKTIYESKLAYSLFSININKRDVKLYIKIILRLPDN